MTSTSSTKVDGVFRMRSLGTATPGITDQYSDGKAAKVWQLYIGKISDKYLITNNDCCVVIDYFANREIMMLKLSINKD